VCLLSRLGADFYDEFLDAVELTNNHRVTDCKSSGQWIRAMLLLKTCFERDVDGTLFNPSQRQQAAQEVVTMLNKLVLGTPGRELDSDLVRNARFVTRCNDVVGPIAYERALQHALKLGRRPIYRYVARDVIAAGNRIDTPLADFSPWLNELVGRSHKKEYCVAPRIFLFFKGIRLVFTVNDKVGTCTIRRYDAALCCLAGTNSSASSTRCVSLMP
jgi:hypothetical protein